MTSYSGNSNLLRAAMTIGLLIAQSQVSLSQTESRVLASYNRTTRPAVSAPAFPAAPVDHQVQPAGFQTPQPQPSTSENHRLLAPPSKKQLGASRPDQTVNAPRSPAFALPKIESFTTASAGLAIVVGLFLVCMWLLRRSGPKPTSHLPSEAVAVIGRIPLAARNFAHLLQVGNKLVLVAITPDGVAPLTEITDPVEVQRMLGVCMQTRKQSTSAEFHDVLKHLTKEPASGFLGNEAATAYSTQAH